YLVFGDMTDITKQFWRAIFTILRQEWGTLLIKIRFIAFGPSNDEFFSRFHTILHGQMRAFFTANTSKPKINLTIFTGKIIRRCNISIKGFYINAVINHF